MVAFLGFYFMKISNLKRYLHILEKQSYKNLSFFSLKK